VVYAQEVIYHYDAIAGVASTDAGAKASTPGVR
jgi:hypothetical protein